MMMMMMLMMIMEEVTKQNQVPNIIPNLPDEIAFEVLSRLPPKSILWFKSVCKAWLNLFSSPDFIKVHLDHTANVQDEANETLIVQSTDVITGTRRTYLLKINNPATTFNLDSAVDFPISSTCHVIINGEPYWLVGDPFCSLVVMRFDIPDKKFRQVPQLRMPYSEDDDARLVNYKDSLAVLVDSTLSLSSLTNKYLGLGSLEHEISERFINMLVIDSEGSWRVEFRVGFPQGFEWVIGSSKSGRMVLQNLSREIVLFDAKNEKIENINVVAAMAGSFNASYYAANFVPVKGSEPV